MASQYIIQKGSLPLGFIERIPEISGSISTSSSTKYLEFEGTKIVYFVIPPRYRDLGGGSVVVPGKVVSDEYETGYGKATVDVEPISKQHQDKIKDLLSEDPEIKAFGIHNYSFWENNS